MTLSAPVEWRPHTQASQPCLHLTVSPCNGGGGTRRLQTHWVCASEDVVLAPACGWGGDTALGFKGWAGQSRPWARTPKKGTPGCAMDQPGSQQILDDLHSAGLDQMISLISGAVLGTLPPAECKSKRRGQRPVASPWEERRAPTRMHLLALVPVLIRVPGRASSGSGGGLGGCSRT